MIASRPLLAVAITAASALAADSSTTISVLYPGLRSQSFVASVVAAVPEATTFAYACPVDDPNGDCPLTQSQTIIQGPSTWSFAYDVSTATPDPFSIKANGDCKLDSAKNTASCILAVSVSSSGGARESSSSTIIRRYRASQAPLVVTAGLEKLSASAGSSSGATSAAPASSSATSASGSSAASASGSSAASASGSSAVSASGSSSRSSTASATAPAQSSNAASPILAQNAMLVAVAAAAGGAMAL